jgi:hypothetical protein
MIFISLLVFLFLVAPARADFMLCMKGNVYTDDSEAEVMMKCGPPVQEFRMDPIEVREYRGDHVVVRVHHRKIWVYPGGSGYVYYLKFENNRLLSIDPGPLGSIPK